MNVLKNFEALFVVTLGLACAANYVLDTDTVTAVEAQPIAARAAAAPAYAAAKDMQVVVVSAKRLSAEQKLQLLNDERKATASAKI
ncbi:hypothetical protein [Pseudoduganella sp. UC29_71]|jgi:hypothetical protein|uniref:hypothetical protein n=1 Tax=Pseudoduganella sp. UC29_71 TaxID=3350174 RepID=UPI0010477372